jgi:prepilin-type N-terminal cleavage/methylation domain-containing protein
MRTSRPTTCKRCDSLPKVLRALLVAHVRQNRTDGFTLLEVIVVVALVALLSVFTLPQISAVFKVSLRTSAREIASHTKEAYNAAVMTGRVHRMVWDLEKDEYWVESGPTDLTLDTEESKELEERRKRFGKDKDEKPNNPFTQDKIITRKKVPLPRGVEFVDIESEKDKAPITEGIAYTHFFPHGMSEQTLIHLRDTSDHKVTLHVAPILGRTRMIEGSASLKEVMSE